MLVVVNAAVAMVSRGIAAVPGVRRSAHPLEDLLLFWLCIQEEAIRSYKADTLVVGAPKPSPEQSEDSDDDDGEHHVACQTAAQDGTPSSILFWRG